jgi:hypothetical protein
MPTRRIFYECRDVSKPSGGIRRLYRHVEILTAHGIPACILHHARGFRISWFETQAPVAYWDRRFAFSPGDILVIPEGHTDVIIATAGAAYERVAIALNWANIYRRLAIGTDWRDYGIRHVIAGSQCERDFLLRSMGLDSVVLASGTDLDLFRDRGGKRLQIAYMPRKNADMFHMIACIFRSRFPQWAHVSFVPIDAVSHHDVARVMAESALFLATSFPEGLARPPIEAMASGCIVVGFAGRGSLEYMQHGESCYRADDGDALSAAEYLDLALQALTGGQAAAMKAAARETAARYSLEREEQRVLEYWQRFLAEHPAPAGSSQPDRQPVSLQTPVSLLTRARRFWR